MKQLKKLALLATVTLGTISCSSNEIIDSRNEQNEIRFAGIQMGNSIISKANKTLSGTETFGVYAYQTTPTTQTWINGQTLSKTETSWRLGSTFYYPVGNFSMSFWAYGKDAEKNIPTSVSKDGLVYENYSVAETTKHADFEAFVISKNVTTVTETSKDNAITLTFWHALSKIQFKANIVEDPALANVDVKITSITINTNQTGNLNYGSEASKWTQTGDMSNVAIALTNSGALTSAPADVTHEFYVIPLADNATNTITVVASFYHKGTDVKIANDVTGTIQATSAQLAINNKVTYNIVLSKEHLSGHTEIKFNEPTIEDWTPVEGGNITAPTQPATTY